MATTLDHLFEHIDLYRSLAEIEDHIAAQLHQRSINAVIVNPVTRHEARIPTDEFITTRELRLMLYNDARSPEWLRREIIWAELGRPA
jgi:hypothetical protein